MKTLRLFVALSFASLAAVAQAAPASAESVQRLLEVTRVQAMLDAMEEQSMPQMFGAMRQRLAQGPNGAATAQAFDRMQPRFTKLVHEAMGWDALGPEYVSLYAQTFSQEEVDGLIAFYQGPLGTALLDKMPQLIQRSMLTAQQRLAPVMRRIEEMTKEEAARQGAKR